ncbi:hypothetical protein SA496_10595 [Pseudomonas sp. JS3066]|uniref:hypothetical protein n=1 Tax=unclassified Pseudomonas TaxID=196821 RepID=UPI00129D970F|nr:MULTISPECIES: hypothetical protein [unclassified Pseudomonas]MDH4652334.1 hypothetical protein [Pseudomonas sp. BN606]MRK24344.1 hypothetical protein [Pseudomonas sp. JG-B]WVK95588.1 hypothetical protein SA496_10595 [Pseudomonas sp. JS3066]
MSARFSVKRVPNVQARGIRNSEALGGTALDCCWYRIIDRATGDYVGGKHQEEAMAVGECQRLNSRT